MNAAIWIVQILLALAFLMSGIMKVIQPIDKLMERGKYIESLNPHSLVRVIGVIEFLGALGLVLPGLTGILPWLTPLAAGGLILTMIGAIVLHVRRHDAMAEVVPSLVLLLLAAFVLYGRAVAVPLV